MIFVGRRRHIVLFNLSNSVRRRHSAHVRKLDIHTQGIFSLFLARIDTRLRYIFGNNRTGHARVGPRSTRVTRGSPLVFSRATLVRDNERFRGELFRDYSRRCVWSSLGQQKAFPIERASLIHQNQSHDCHNKCRHNSCDSPEINGSIRGTRHQTPIV